MLFVLIMEDLKRNIESNKSVLEMNLKKNPSLTYYKVNELANFVGRRYNIELKIHRQIPQEISNPKRGH